MTLDKANIKMKYCESNNRSIRDILQCQPQLPFFKSVRVKSQIIVSGTFVNGIYYDILSQTAIRKMKAYRFVWRSEGY